MQYGSWKNGLFNFSDKRNICSRNYIPQDVSALTVESNEYKVAIVVYNSTGKYIRTDAWYTKGQSYTFDELCLYKIYINTINDSYLYNYPEAVLSVSLEIQPRRNLNYSFIDQAYQNIKYDYLSKTLESMMRRDYDISYANAPEPIKLYTYLQNEQIVHPKVLYFPDKFSKHCFWMAYTPYPYANPNYENPCIAYSDDGYSWTNIDGNPLDDPGGASIGTNTDTHLVYNDSNNTLEVWWRYITGNTEVKEEILYRKISSNGFSWSDKEVINSNVTGDHVHYLSPCINYDNGIYKVWVVNDTEKLINYYEGTETPDAIPEEQITPQMTVGKVDQAGRVDNENTSYQYTEKITLNATKSFQLTAVNKNGITVHPLLRYVTAYDAEGDLLPDSCLQSIEASTAAIGRIVIMDEKVDSIIVTVASNMSDIIVTLDGRNAISDLNFVRSIDLNYSYENKEYTIWHMDMIKDNDKLVLLTMCKNKTDWMLFLSTSEDNETFTTPEAVMVGNPYGWDTRLYRSSIVNVDGEYRIYYSAQDELQRYGLGLCTSNTLSNFVAKQII